MASAALFANYTHAEFKPGLKVCRIVLEIPQEKRKEFFDAFGYPDPANPVPVFIARRAKDAVAEPLSSGAPAPERSEPSDKPVRHLRDMPPSQQAALKLRDSGFQAWLRKTYPFASAWNDGMNPDLSNAERCNSALKGVLEIDSKTELDANEAAAARWQALLTDYDMKAYTR